MRRFLKLALATSVFILSLSFTVTAFAQISDSKFNLNFAGSAVEFAQDEAPINIDHRTLLQLDAMYKLIDEDSTGGLDWNEADSSITIKKGDKTVVLWIGSSEAQINGEKVAIEGATPALYNNKTYVPLRFIANAFDLVLSWNPYTSTANLAKKSEVLEIADTLLAQPLNQAANKYSADAIFSANASMSSDTSNYQIYGKMGYRANIDLANQFLSADADISAGVDALSDNSFGKTNFSLSHDMDVSMYDDGEYTYTSVGDKQEYSKIDSIAAELFELLNVGASVDPNTQADVNELLGELDFDYNWLAGLSLKEDEQGNQIIEGDIIPESLFDKLMAEIYYLVDDSFSIDTPVINIKIIKAKDTNILSYFKMALDLGFTFEMDYSFIPLESLVGRQNVKLNVSFEIPTIDYNATFESTVPSEIKENAIDPYDYSNYDYDDYDYDYDYYGYDDYAEEIASETDDIDLHDLDLSAFGLEDADLGASYDEKAEESNEDNKKLVGSFVKVFKKFVDNKNIGYHTKKPY